MLPRRSIYDATHDQLRESVRRFLAREVAPSFEAWEEAGMVDRSFWQKAGGAGLLCPQAPAELGGSDASFLTNAVIIEEMFYSGFTGPATDMSVHNDVCAGYIMSYATDEQKARWLPAMARGELVVAIAMTEPGAGSNLQGIRTRAVLDGDDYVISGQKTFISNGQHANLVIVVAKTKPELAAKGVSLIAVETSRPGFRRGRNLDKLGHLSADTSELFFDEVRVPASNLLGPPEGGFGVLMSELPQERLAIGLQSMAQAQRAYDITVDYVREREAFGAKIAEFQNTRFRLADLKSDLMVGWAYIDQCLRQHEEKALSNTDASIAKLWCTEMHGRLVDTCVQFFGGYGFMREYEICRLYADARVFRVYGGTSEIMRELVSRNLDIR